MSSMFPNHGSRISLEEENPFPSYEALQDIIDGVKINTKLHEYVLYEIFVDDERFHLIVGDGALELRHDDDHNLIIRCDVEHLTAARLYSYIQQIFVGSIMNS